MNVLEERTLIGGGKNKKIFDCFYLLLITFLNSVFSGCNFYRKDNSEKKIDIRRHLRTKFQSLIFIYLARIYCYINL